jgi:hypothetical protein
VIELCGDAPKKKTKHHQDREVFGVGKEGIPWRAEKKTFKLATTGVLHNITPHYQPAKGFFLGGMKIKVVDEPFLELEDYRHTEEGRVIDKLIAENYNGVVRKRWLGRLVRVCRVESDEGISDWAQLAIYRCQNLKPETCCPIFQEHASVVSWIRLDDDRALPSVRILARAHVLPYPFTSKTSSTKKVSLNVWLRRKHAAFDVSPTSYFLGKINLFFFFSRSLSLSNIIQLTSVAAESGLYISPDTFGG